MSLITVGLAQLFEFLWVERRTRHADIIAAALRHLYHNVFGATAGHRVTFLARRRRNSVYIRPRYRYSLAEGNELTSRARFRKGTALAGLAWERPSEIQVRELPELDHIGQRPPWWQLRRRSDWRHALSRKREAFLEHCRTILHLTSVATASRLSRTTWKLRWILCYGIASQRSLGTHGVLSLDSEKEQPFDQKRKEEIYDAIVTVAAIIAGVLDDS